MWNRCGSRRLRTFITLLWMTSLAFARPRNFVPDAAFKGSSLTGWHPLGQADWRAHNGEIIGAAKPDSNGGWLFLNRDYQDVEFVTTFQCAAECNTGVLLRAEKIPGGGIKGIFTSIEKGEIASYRITLDSEGKETSREKLRPALQILRFAPPPPTTPPATPARASGGRGIPLMPNGTPNPISRPSSDIRPGDWNVIELLVDANTLRGWLNDDFAITTGVAEEEFGRYGPIALYVGSGEVRFKDIAYKDFEPKKYTPEQTSLRFRKQKLNSFYLSWGPAVADINRDGIPDIVAGPYYYLGPDYTTAKEIYPAITLNPSTDFYNGVQFAYDFTADGWPDVLNLQLGKPAVLYVNPKGESHRWQAYNVISGNTCETWVLKDINGDGKPELIYKDVKDRIAWAAPDPANPTGPWIEHPISEAGPWPNHGLGVGDINGDGRMDVLGAYGWWEQPKEGADKNPWKYHPQAFSDWNRTAQGGAEMAVYDVNGDGLNDVVTSLHAHGWGLAWFEQKRDASGNISFVEHKVMGDFSSNNPGGVTFSELHGSAVADIDGDGIPDFITGKRYWSHLDGTLDPDPQGTPVLYVFRTVRNPKVAGGAELVPELVNNASGVGSGLAIADLNGDGAPEIITSTRFGTDIFWNNWKKRKATAQAKH